MITRFSQVLVDQEDISGNNLHKNQTGQEILFSFSFIAFKAIVLSRNNINTTPESGMINGRITIYVRKTL